MKKIFFTLVLFCTAFMIKAQVQVSLNVDAHPTPELSKWMDREELAILTVTNTDRYMQGRRYRIKAKVFLDGKEVLETNNNTSILTLEMGTETYLADEIIPYNSLVFKDNSMRKKILRTGMLPAGLYSFCISLVDLKGAVISTPEQICSPITITDYQMPELLNPIADRMLSPDLLPSTIFKWTPVSPQPPASMGVKYLLTISEVKNGQKPTQALLVNYPIIEEEITAGTQFNWPLDIEAPDETTQYVWSVKPVTNDDKPFIENRNGFVTPKTFKIGKKTNNRGQTDCLCSDESTLIPKLTLSQPEPENNPRKLQIDGVVALRDYIWNCNDTFKKPNQNMVVKIEWDNKHTSNLTGKSLFTHTYEITDSIPEQVCVSYIISDSFGNKEELCNSKICIDVPENIQDTDITAGGTVSPGQSIYAGKHNDTGKGEFEIVTTEIQESQGGKYSGKGTVYINWARANFKVEFKNISIDTTRNLVGGKISVLVNESAPQYPQDWAIEFGASIPWVNNAVEDVIDWVGNATNANIPYNGLEELSNQVTMPSGFNFPNGNQLAITEMVFEYNKAELNIVTALNTPANWGTQQRIGFLAKKVLFHPSKIEFPPQRLDLVEDISVGNADNNVSFKFVAPKNNNTGCYIEWGENGFSEFGVEIETSFTRNWLLPNPDNGSSKVTTKLTAVGSDWNDLLLTGNMPKSTIVNSQNMTIEASSIVYDMSDERNADDISFPDNYEGETSNLFRGFYIKKFSLQFPESWSTSTEGQPQVQIENMIIDNMGITLDAEANNIVSFPNAEIADLYASIDTLKVDIQASSLRESSIKGRIGLPISTADSIKNPLRYNALLSLPANPNEENLLQLVIEPTGTIYTNFLKGDMDLEETSNITAKYYGSGKKTFDLNLNGKFGWNNIKLGTINNVKLKMKFQDLGMNYDSSKSSGKLNFNIGTWAFASPQKFLANFPITIDNVDFENLPKSGNELLKGRMKIPVVFNLSNKIGGHSGLTVEGKIEDLSSEGGKKFTPKFIKASVDSIEVHADMAAVKIDGHIKFRDSDPTYGNGFKGQLDANFKAVGIKVGALTEFGNTTYENNNERYRYWRVEADAQFPAPGVPFLPGMAFRGFGGGAFKNMEATLSNNSYTFKPKKSSYGFKAKTVLATTPKEETFNADVGLLGQFSNTGGMSLISFTGDFYVAAGFNNRDKAKIKGNMNVSYDFPEKHFNMSANVDVNADPITAEDVALALDINGKTNKWYFKFGEPQNLNTVKVFGLSLYEYLMFGNDITPPNGFTSTFNNAYHNVFNHHPNGSNIGTGGVGNMTNTGRGFALGIGFKFKASDSWDFWLFNGKIGYDLDAGAELHLGFAEYNGSCNGNSPIGINGWRVSGGLGFYGAASAHFTYKNLWGNMKKVNLIGIKGGGWIYGEFPKPHYVAGNVEGSVKILGINVHINRYFTTGTSCGNLATVEGASNIQQGDAVADQDQELIKYVAPQQQTFFPTSSPIVVKYALTPDETFDVSEQQSDGTVKIRTFKMVVDKSLKIRNDNTWVNIPIVASENNLGEYLYTTIAMQQEQTTAANTATLNALIPGHSGANPLGSMEVANSSSNVAITNNTDGLATTQSMITIYPAPSGNSGGYSDLPPEPDPIQNNLSKDKGYKFTVTATLKEWNGSNWINAVKNDGSPVNQTITKIFRTGAPVSVSQQAEQIQQIQSIK